MIQINDKVRIVRVDKLNLELQEYRKIVDVKTKEERYDWCWVGFYGDFKSAIGGVLKHFTMEMTEQDIKGCENILKCLEKIDIELKNAVKDLKG